MAHNKNQSYTHQARRSLHKILLDCELLTNKPKKHQRYCSSSPNPTTRRIIQFPDLKKSRSLVPFAEKKVSIPTKTKRKKLYQIVKRHKHHYGPKNASKSNIFVEESPKKKRYRDSQEDEEFLLYEKMIEERKKLQESRRLIVLSKIIKENVRRKSNQIQIKQKLRMRDS